MISEILGDKNKKFKLNGSEGNGFFSSKNIHYSNKQISLYPAAFLSDTHIYNTQIQLIHNNNAHQ